MMCIIVFPLCYPFSFSDKHFCQVLQYLWGHQTRAVPLLIRPFSRAYLVFSAYVANRAPEWRFVNG